MSETTDDLRQAPRRSLDALARWWPIVLVTATSLGGTATYLVRAETALRSGVDANRKAIERLNLREERAREALSEGRERLTRLEVGAASAAAVLHRVETQITERLDRLESRAEASERARKEDMAAMRTQLQRLLRAVRAR